MDTILEDDNTQGAQQPGSEQVLAQPGGTTPPVTPIDPNAQQTAVDPNAQSGEPNAQSTDPNAQQPTDPNAAAAAEGIPQAPQQIEGLNQLFPQHEVDKEFQQAQSVKAEMDKLIAEHKDPDNPNKMEVNDFVEALIQKMGLALEHKAMGLAMMSGNYSQAGAFQASMNNAAQLAQQMGFFNQHPDLSPGAPPSPQRMAFEGYMRNAAEAYTAKNPGSKIEHNHSHWLNTAAWAQAEVAKHFGGGAKQPAGKKAAGITMPQPQPQPQYIPPPAVSAVPAATPNTPSTANGASVAGASFSAMHNKLFGNPGAQ